MIRTERVVPLPPDRREILRYAGAKEGDRGLSELLEACLSETEGIITPCVCFEVFDVTSNAELVDLTFARVASATCQKRLDGCRRVLAFAATAGIEIDRRIARAAVTSPARALLLQAIGAERIEAICDAFEENLRPALRAEGFSMRPRFSPGYGDLPLALQRDLFRVLEPAHRIGLTLNESLLMTPTKSVTALIGLSETSENA